MSSTRIRRLSNSSMASDVSFRLPTYDLTSPSVYNFQSDLDASASEFEDGASTTGYGAQLDVISKEKLYDAYKKSAERFQKYRGRYTELVRRYRDLERDNNKARVKIFLENFVAFSNFNLLPFQSVLVETQDKALRRISELREQCSLEQQAKAHLESALRMEMDEQQCVIKSLKTKLSLLGENPEEIVKNGKDNLINLSDDNGRRQSDQSIQNSLVLLNIDDTTESHSANPAEQENLIVAGASIMINDSNEKISKLEILLADEKNKLSELQRKFEISHKQINELHAREEENTFLLAQNKLAIHSELENREKEINSLKNDVKQSANEKECLNEIVTELREENSKANARLKELVDAKRALEHKLEELKRSSTTFEGDLKELQAKVIVLESEKQSIVSKNQTEIEKFKARYDSLQRKNEQLEEISRTKVIESRAKLETELKQIKSAHAEISKQFTEQTAKTQQLELRNQNVLAEHQAIVKQLTFDLDAIKADKSKLEDRFKQQFEEKQHITTELEAIRTKFDESQNKIAELQLQVAGLSEENKNAQVINKNSELEVTERERLESSIKANVNTLNQQLLKLTEENKNILVQLKHTQKEKNESLADITNLKTKVDSLKNEKRDLEKTLEKEIRDKTELQTQVTNILQEIGRLEDELKEVRQSHAELEEEKLELEEKTIKLKGAQTEAKVKGEKQHTQQLTQKQKEHETKLKSVESENSQLIEKNRSLEESIKRQEIAQSDLESLLELEHKQNQELNDRISALSVEIDSLKEEHNRLQEKLKQSLDDYAELFNTKEQMDQEHRSLLDQIETKEKEKLCLISSNEILESDLAKRRTLEEERTTLATTCDRLREELDAVRNENEMLSVSQNQLEAQVKNLTSTINQIEMVKQTLQQQLHDLLSQQAELKKQTSDLEMSLNQSNSEKDQMKESLQSLASLQERLDGSEQAKIENEYLNKSVVQLEEDLKKIQTEKTSFEEEISELKEKLKSQQCELYVLSEEHAKRSDIFDEKDQEIQQLKTICQRSQDFTQELQTEISQQLQQLGAIKLLNDELQQGKDSIEKKHAKLLKTHQELNQLLEQKTSEFKSEIEKMAISQHAQAFIAAELEEKKQVVFDLKQQLANLQKEIDSSRAIINDFNTDLNEQNKRFDQSESKNLNLKQQIEELKSELAQKATVEHIVDDPEVMRRNNQQLQYELVEAKQIHEREISDLNHEIDELKENAKAYREKQMELEQLRLTNDRLTQEIVELKERQQNHIKIQENFNRLQNDELNRSDDNELQEHVHQLREEKDKLETKLEKILNEVQDVSIRNLFLEQQCENSLILEQSNERLKLQNSKLSRQLDETLVS